jgi:hypothetical protein
MLGKKKGASMVQALVGIMVVIIIAVAVVVPTVQNIIDNGNFTGTTATLLGIVPLLIVVGIVLLVVGMYKFS